MHPYPDLDSYGNKYQHAVMSRENGILEVRIQSADGGPFVWTYPARNELGFLFAEIAADLENKVVIITGTGDSFIAEEVLTPGKLSAETWGTKNMPDTMRLVMNQVNVPMPMIAAVNGPASLHAEIALLCDVVIASSSTHFADETHFSRGIVPGDGVHVIWPHLLGLNRGRYFLLTGQRIEADEALRLGLVGAVLPQAEVLPRAREIAAQIASRPVLTVRLAREAMLQPLKRALLNDLGYGLALEGLGLVASRPFGDGSEGYVDPQS
jgi:enoyl-CoA hydratase/carnithine racemase